MPIDHRRRVMPLPRSLHRRWLVPVICSVVAACVMALWYSGEIRRQRLPAKPLRVGFHNSPPHQFVSGTGEPFGPVIDIVREASRRADVRIEWVYAPYGPERSLRAGYVDVWPLLGFLPARKTYLHFSEPWTSLSFWMVSREIGGRTPRNVAGGVQ